MTLDQIKEKLRQLNEDVIKVGMNSSAGGYIDWENEASNRVKEILEDEDIRRIILTGTPEERNGYTEAIQEGIQLGIERLKECMIRLHEEGRTDRENSFNNIVLQSEQLADTISRVEAVDNDQEEFMFTDEERIQDLDKKIYYLDSTIEMRSKMEQLGSEITIRTDESIQDKAIELSESIEVKLEECKNKLELISELRDSKDEFMACFEEVSSLCDSGLLSVKNVEQRKKIEQLIKYTKMVDTVDGLDSNDANKLNLGEPQYIIKKGKTIITNKAVKEWVAKMKLNLSDETKAKKLHMEPEFFDSREKVVKDEFVDLYKNSIVHKTLSPEFHKMVLEDDTIELEVLEENIADLSDRLKKYKLLSNKTPEELLEYKKEAEKLLDAYKRVAEGSKKITIKGKVKQLQTDMTDVSKKYDAVKEILNLDKDDELKQEVEIKALVLAGKRPTDKWYHKFARFITLGMYKTPEQKYERKLYSKKVEVVEKLITENKESVDEANQKVEHDKNTYKEAARKKIYDDKDKKIEERKFDKKEVLKSKDADDGRTR